jgi:hypothetical protein
MDFTVEFYETESRTCPVRDLDDLKATDPDNFAAVVAGLAKLRNSQYHREPLSKALSDGLFELRHVGKLNSRVLWFFHERQADRPAARHPQQGTGDPGARSRHRAGTHA